MLMARRIDVALVIETEVKELLALDERAARELRVLSPVANESYAYVGFNQAFAQAHRARVEAFWDEIARIRASADWQAFAEKFSRDTLAATP